MGAIPDHDAARIRTLSLLRVARLETSWAAVSRGDAGPPLAAAMARDLQLLQQGAVTAGLVKVGDVCDCIGKVLGFAKENRFAIPQEVDFLMTTAIHYLSILVRGGREAHQRDDLAGLLRQLDDALAEAGATSKEPPQPLVDSTKMLEGAKSAREHAEPVSVRPMPKAEHSHFRPTTKTCHELAMAATGVFLEQLFLPTSARARLYDAWQVLTTELGALERVPLIRVVERGALLALGKGRGKIDIAYQSTGASLSIASAEALESAMILVVGRAVEGTATPTVRVYGDASSDTAKVTIELDAGPRAAMGRDGLHVDNAIQSAKALLSGLDGSIAVQRPAGGGITITLRAPLGARRADVRRFRAPFAPVDLAVSSDWSVDAEVDPAAAAKAVDLLALGAGLPGKSQAGEREPIALRLKKGQLQMTVLAASGAFSATADRPCPTSDHDPLEVVTIDGVEVVLVRPELLRNALPTA